jgi:hypothetical protein
MSFLTNSPLIGLIKTVGVLGALLVLLYSCSTLKTETYLSEGTSSRGFDEYCTEWTIEFFGGERQIRKNCHAVDPNLMPGSNSLNSGSGLSDPGGQQNPDFGYTEWDVLYSDDGPTPNP